MSRIIRDRFDLMLLTVVTATVALLVFGAAMGWWRVRT